jgi:hypothetical protein
MTSLLPHVTPSTSAPPGDFSRSDQEVVELHLLLPRSQAQAIEEAARARGMTTGQILRRVIADLFVPEPNAIARG